LSASLARHFASLELRQRLRIERWLVSGNSWGQPWLWPTPNPIPGGVTEMVLTSVVTTTRAEVDWITRAMGRAFPQAWEAFRAAAAVADPTADLQGLGVLDLPVI